MSAQPGAAQPDAAQSGAAQSGEAQSGEAQSGASQSGEARPGIDPRGPRFGAGITAVLLLIAIGLDLSGSFIAAAAVFAVIVAVFAWGAFAGIRRHPYGRLFQIFIRPRLGAPTELEDPAAPTFAQGVGFVITAVGLVLALASVPWAIAVAGSLAFVAAFLNSVFGYCLGCQIYVLLVRARVIRRSPARA